MITGGILAGKKKISMISKNTHKYFMNSNVVLIIKVTTTVFFLQLGIAVSKSVVTYPAE